jgi:uncharacterized protein YlaN (UPF0358 family)
MYACGIRSNYDICRYIHFIVNIDLVNKKSGRFIIISGIIEYSEMHPLRIFLYYK